MIKQNKAITLTELVAVGIIILLIAGAAIPVYRNNLESHREKEAKAAIDLLAIAENRYYLNSGRYWPVFGSHVINSDDDLIKINSYLGLRLPASGVWRYEFYPSATGGSLDILTFRKPSGGQYKYKTTLNQGESPELP